MLFPIPFTAYLEIRLWSARWDHLMVQEKVKQQWLYNPEAFHHIVIDNINFDSIPIPFKYIHVLTILQLQAVVTHRYDRISKKSCVCGVVVLLLLSRYYFTHSSMSIKLSVHLSANKTILQFLLTSRLYFSTCAAGHSEKGLM